jgi:hypothetical protein
MSNTLKQQYFNHAVKGEIYLDKKQLAKIVGPCVDIEYQWN